MKLKNELSAGKRILVMGVGRSGTTALYGLLQHILEDRYPDDVDYVYEPFLWDRKTFNKLYTELSEEFCYASSVSVEGMYNHKRLPMLVADDSVVDQTSMEWLATTLTPGDGKRHYLGKVIRANGRIRLIRELVPTAKIIFVIRNPIDVLNSATQLFSFYGGEFYESDFGRFAAEVENRFRMSIEPSSTDSSELEAEYAYWYFSNLAFLEYTKQHPENILTIAYEAFVESRSSTVSRICEFIDIDFQPSYAAASMKTVGAVEHKKPSLNKEEFSFLKRKLQDYGELLNFVLVTPSLPFETHVKVTQASTTERVITERERFNALFAANELNRVKSELVDLRMRYSQASAELIRFQFSKRHRFVDWLLRPVDRLRSLRKENFR